MVKKVLGIILSLTITLSIFTLPYVYAAEEILYEDDFETGVYTTIDGVNPLNGNNIKQLLKDGEAQWTFEKSSGKSFTGWPENLVIQNTPEGSGTPNDTKVLFTSADGAFKQETLAWCNLVDQDGQPYDKGIITIDYRIKRPASNNNPGITLLLFDTPVTGYSPRPNMVLKMELNVASDTKVTTRNAGEYVDDFSERKNTTFQHGSSQSTKAWWYFRVIVNIDEQTFHVQYSNTTREALTDWETFNFIGNGSAIPYVMADTVGAIAFEGKSYLGLDDVKITYEKPEEPAIVSGLSLTDQSGTVISSPSPISLDEVTHLGATAYLNRPSGSEKDITARLIIAAYDDKDQLLAVRSGADTTVTEASPTSNMTSGMPLDISDFAANIDKIKVFAWDFDLLYPYGILVQDIQ